jgi:hypothetical protein
MPILDEIPDTGTLIGHSALTNDLSPINQWSIPVADGSVRSAGIARLKAAMV